MLMAASPDDPLHQLLTRRLFGISPMAAREIAARAAGDPQAPVQAVTAHILAEAVAEILAPIQDGSWAPHVALDVGNDVIAFAPYEPRQFASSRPVPSISDAMWRYFEQCLSADAYAAARWRVQERIDEIRARTESTSRQLEENIADATEIERLREAGELLLTYQGQVKRDASEVTVPDYAGAPRTIKLQPKLTAVENAQAYFHRYRKAIRGAEDIPARIKSTQTDLAYLEQLAVDLAQAESRPEIDAVYNALVRAGWAKASHNSSGQVKEPRHFEIGGFLIQVGRNARQNEHITRRAGPDDLWLHARGVPGAHVIVRSGQRDVPDDVIEQAAGLAAYYSSAREENMAAVDVTRRRYVKRVRGSRPGLVTYRNERTIQAKPTKPDASLYKSN
jgi:predicted ribosome quality control (RQC) complex YloA/Tae2 family protein